MWIWKSNKKKCKQWGQFLSGNIDIKSNYSNSKFGLQHMGSSHVNVSV